MSGIAGGPNGLWGIPNEVWGPIGAGFATIITGAFGFWRLNATYRHNAEAQLAEEKRAAEAKLTEEKRAAEAKLVEEHRATERKRADEEAKLNAERKGLCGALIADLTAMRNLARTELGYIVRNDFTYVPNVELNVIYLSSTLAISGVRRRSG